MKMMDTEIMKQLNPLFGKVAVFDGDSICYGSTGNKADSTYGWGYAKRIGMKNHMRVFNEGIGGGTITVDLFFDDGRPRHWISSNIESIRAKYARIDYLILEGGTNDADLLGKAGVAERFGEITDKTDFSGKYDDTTFCGAVETLFYKAVRYYPTAKIGFIIAQNMDNNANREAYFNVIAKICEKWGIPYLDLWHTCHLNPAIPEHYTAGNSHNLYQDGQHLTAKGYDVIADIIDHWMKTL